ncbi:hypothetical protein VV01_14295 [Luteipulveratus halotolerans]|uniref:Uncharacterized protein n=1 Tax=Luteipulveratus halotolerans TaxID=1631356 RepID=A0A0L6CJZ8_9MICO|nr:hypothetical protein VV01_14295 [Luteipulveratus halotolerans]
MDGQAAPDVVPEEELLVDDEDDAESDELADDVLVEDVVEDEVLDAVVLEEELLPSPRLSLR